MKKIIAFLSVLIISMLLSACGDPADNMPTLSGGNGNDSSPAAVTAQESSALDSETGASSYNTIDPGDNSADLGAADEQAETKSSCPGSFMPGKAAQEMKDFLKEHEAVYQDENYSVYELPFEREGMNIYGQLFLPEGEEDEYPLVIIGHGLQSSYSDCIPDAQHLADAGIAAYVFDFCGGSYYSESDGDYWDMSVITEKDDMRSVLDSLKEMAFFDSEKIFLMGESQGGFAAALLAAEQQEDICGLILFFPGFTIPDNARLVFGQREMIPDDPAI